MGLYKIALLYKQADPYGQGVNTQQYRQTGMDPAMQKHRQMRTQQAWNSYTDSIKGISDQTKQNLKAIGDWGLNMLGTAVGVSGSAHKGAIHAPFAIASEFGRMPEYVNRAIDVGASYVLPSYRNKYSDVKTTGLSGVVDRMNASADRYTDFYTPVGLPTRLTSMPSKALDAAGQSIAETSTSTVNPLGSVASNVLRYEYPASDWLARMAGQTATVAAGSALTPMVAGSRLPNGFKSWWKHTFPAGGTAVNAQNAEEVAGGVAQGFTAPDAPR